MLISCMLRFLLVIFLIPISVVGFSQGTKENSVQFCNHKGHALCIKITAKEVFADGVDGKWSRHWKQMSYIGKACVKEHGKKKGKALEAAFAPGHYFAMFWVNVSGLTKYGFTGKKKREELKTLDTANR
jgi:hypothetical protein